MVVVAEREKGEKMEMGEEREQGEARDVGRLTSHSDEEKRRCGASCLLSTATPPPKPRRTRGVRRIRSKSDDHAMRR